MDYLEFLFFYDAENAFIGDLLAAELAEIGFESFLEDEQGLKAYIPVEKWDEKVLKEKLAFFPFVSGITYSQTYVKSQNWNEEWEKNYFQPIVIGGDCVIHSTFHKDIPDAKYDIVIGPVANDDIALLFRQYAENLITLEMLARGMEFRHLNSQFSFHTEKALQTLKFRGIIYE